MLKNQNDQENSLVWMFFKNSKKCAYRDNSKSSWNIIQYHAENWVIPPDCDWEVHLFLCVCVMPPHEGSLHTRLLVTDTSINKSSGRNRGSIVGPLAIRIWISKSSLMPIQIPSINYHSFMRSICKMPCLLAPAKILSSRAPRKLATGETVKV